MYHCHLQFYLSGYPCRVFETIRNMAPLERFSHEFYEGEKPQKALIAKADVIFAALSGLDVKETIQALLADKKKETELILLAEKEQAALLTDYLPEITDLWIMPMSDEEISFRFLRWQQACKQTRDYWQTSQFFEATINNVPNLIWYKDKDGKHEKVNDSFCRTVGKTREQVEGRGHAYIWNVEQDDPACIDSENEVMSKRKTCISEEVIKTGDGIRILTTYKSPLYDLDGSVMGTVGVAIDITRERDYELDILNKNRTLETIFTTLDCGLIRHTIDGKHITRVNRAALKILGYESLEELEKGFDMVAESVVEEDREVVKKAVCELKGENDSTSVEYRVRRKNGEIRHVMGNIKLVKDKGELVYQRFLLDCTTQKREEKRKERRRQEMLQALSADLNVVWIFDLDSGKGSTIHNIDSRGNKSDPIFGGTVSLEEGLELYIQKYVHEDDREMLKQALNRDYLLKELTEKKMHFVNYRALKDGKTYYYQMKIVRVGNWSEDHSMALGLRSVDEEIRSEMEKRNMLEDALSQANKASQAKSVFLSNMSHDIRTPMNAIVGFTNLALSRIDNQSQVEEYLGKIKTSGNHLLGLINDILDMSRIESGKVHLEEAPCSLEEILNGLRNILQADVRAKHQELLIDMEDVRNRDVYCDKLRLNQVLLNILSNSVKYTEAGGRIIMKVTQKEGAPLEHSNYEFTIKDNGIGMSEEFVTHLFEPFERERNSTISKIQGTGLGMAITKSIVDIMNGSIAVKSKKGVGTEFTVSFTFRLGSRQEAEKETIKDVREEAKRIPAGRILLAEDVELNQEIAVTILEDAGFKTEVAGNGQIAVDMLKKSEPGYYQLVLMDVQMPVMDGYAATMEIRKLENKELANIPILAMTANAFEEDRRTALKCGMNGHIAKPIDIAKLFETLEQILS